MTPEEFVGSYGLDAIVAFDSGMQITLGQALEMESLCEANPDVKQDPARRIRWLAGRLAAGNSLREEDTYLLDEIE